MTSPNQPLNQNDSSIYDEDLVLSDNLSANVTTTSSSTPIAIKLGENISSKAVINITSLDSTTGNETYNLAVAVSDSSTGTFSTVASVAPTGTGVYELAMTGPGVNKIDSDSAYARLVWTLGGTTPIIKFVSYLTKI